MRTSAHFNAEPNFLVTPHHFRRMTWATVAAAACGVIGGAAGLFSLTTGHEFDFPRAPVPSISEYADELAYDFAALQGSEITGSPTAVVSAAEVPTAMTADVAPSSAEAVGKRCMQGTWPFFDDTCLWETAAQTRHRKRIVFRLRSPWCSNLYYSEGAYYCRSRT